ncbi:hypothetical protein U7230_12450 [Carboxydochorda subterranea]|uniref:Lipoprotein n=1 Tax=Carboxydichorda subterranea TaxID=3109565 RepID=A0ABZ1BVR9_9FIRM|nr:hypothetical protein [Limnochorda sp. L945t]WRP16885.1 hypothetical protein U7230_12450 [Limnochorda sp. L945t]
MTEVKRRFCGAVCAAIATAISVAFVGMALAAAGLCAACALGLVGAF